MTTHGASLRYWWGREPSCTRLATLWVHLSGVRKVVGDMRSRDPLRHCETVVQDMDVPVPFSLAEFCRRLEHRRGREIRLVPVVTRPGGPCGLWVATAGTDVIFHEAATSRLHRDHIVLHEIGHLLCDHRGGPAVDIALAGMLLPSLDPGMVARVLGRAAYTDTEEREAELFASLILERADRASAVGAVAPPPLDPDTAAVLGRVESVFAASSRH